MTTLHPCRGFCSLPVRQRRALAAFVTAMPPRIVAELLLHVAAEGLDVAETLDLVDDWRRRLSPPVIAASHADRMPASVLRVVG